MEYRFVFERGWVPSILKREFKKSVNEYIKEGFKPYGSIAATQDGGTNTIFQAMIKED